MIDTSRNFRYFIYAYTLLLLLLFVALINDRKRESRDCNNFACIRLNRFIIPSRLQGGREGVERRNRRRKQSKP